MKLQKSIVRSFYNNNQKKGNNYSYIYRLISQGKNVRAEFPHRYISICEIKGINIRILHPNPKKQLMARKLRNSENSLGVKSTLWVWNQKLNHIIHDKLKNQQKNQLIFNIMPCEPNNN